MSLTGKSGVVRVDEVGQPGGTYAIAEVKSWTVEQQVDVLDTTTMGSGDDRTYVSSIAGWTGSVDVIWDDPYDEAEVISVGKQILIDFYPDGSPTGEVIGGTCTVTGVSVSASFDGLVEASISVEGTGQLFV